MEDCDDDINVQFLKSKTKTKTKTKQKSKLVRSLDLELEFSSDKNKADKDMDITHREKTFLEKANSDEKYKGKSGLFRRSPLRLLSKRSKSNYIVQNGIRESGENRDGNEKRKLTKEEILKLKETHELLRINVGGGLGDRNNNQNINSKNDEIDEQRFYDDFAEAYRSATPSPRNTPSPRKNPALSRASSSKRRSSFSGFIHSLLPKSSSNSSVSSSVSASGSATNSLNTSPRWEIGGYYDSIKCCNCPIRLDLNISTEKMLAVKCTCHPNEFFCSRHCHRVHWITLRKCDEFLFENVEIPNRKKDIYVKSSSTRASLEYIGGSYDSLSVFDIPLTWEEPEFVHDIDDYFPDYCSSCEEKGVYNLGNRNKKNK